MFQGTTIDELISLVESAETYARTGMAAADLQLNDHLFPGFLAQVQNQLTDLVEVA